MPAWAALWQVAEYSDRPGLSSVLRMWTMIFRYFDAIGSIEPGGPPERPTNSDYTSQGSSVPMIKFKLPALKDSGCCAFAAFLVVSAVSLSSNAAPPQLPTWPQKFDIGGPETATFGFIVTQPGPVAIDIQTNGAPVVATLQGAVPRAAEQGGSGTLHLVYQVTPQNLQVSALWTVHIVLVPPAAAAGARAGGTIVVHAPPVNPAAAQALLDKANAQAQSSRQAVAQRRQDPQAAAAQAAQRDAVL